MLSHPLFYVVSDSSFSFFLKNFEYSLEGKSTGNKFPQFFFVQERLLFLLHLSKDRIS